MSKIFASFPLKSQGIRDVRCRAGALRGPRPVRGGYTGFALGLPMVGMKIPHRDQRERQPKGYTSHEVTAPRVAGPTGRSSFSKPIQSKHSRQQLITTQPLLLVPDNRIHDQLSDAERSGHLLQLLAHTLRRPHKIAWPLPFFLS
jgi:hypothetical protein